MAFQVFFAITVFFNLDIEKIDVKTTFLYNFIDQLVYTNILKKLETKTNCHMVCKLLKALYNLKQLLQF